MAQPTPEGLSARIDGHDTLLEKNDDEHKSIWKSFDRVQNRLPHWAMFLIASLTGILGALLKAVF